MAQSAQNKLRLSEHQTNALIFRLEDRKYGHHLSSMELAQKANVSLDYVNRIENQQPVEDRHALERIAHALGITADLLCKIAGLAEITDEEYRTLESCFELSPHGEEVPPQCASLGFERVYH